MSQSQPLPPEPVPPPAIAEPAAPPRGIVDHVVGLFTEPRTEFAQVLRRPGRWWIPLLGAVVLNLAFTAIWLQKVDPEQFMRNQLADSSRFDQMSPEQVDQIVTQQARFMKVFSWVGALLGAPIGVALLGGLFLFIYRFFYGGDVTFKQSLAVVAWTFFVVGLVSVPAMLAVYAAKGDWNINPQAVVQANLSLVLEKETSSPVLYALAESLDLFSFWTLFLLACGYGVACRRSTGSALWGVAVPWAIWVLGRAAIAAF